MKAVKNIYHVMDGISNVAQKILEGITAFLVITCAMDLFFQVIYRFIIIKFVSFSFPFTEEYARYALIWMSYLCAGMCYKNGSMAAVNIVFDRLKPTPRTVVYFLTRILFVVFLVVGIKYGYQATMFNTIYKSPVMRVPGVFLYSAPMVGCILMAYELVTEVLGVIAGEIVPFVGRPDPVDETELENM